MAFVEPLDLQTWFVSYLAGSQNIFVGLSVITIAILAGIFRMPNTIALIMFAVFFVIMANFMPGIYALFLIIAGVLIFYSIGRIFKY